MAEPSPEIHRLTDLADPQLSDSQRAALAFGESVSVELSVDAVLASAREQTGLSDFGPEDFVERLALWLDEIDQDEERTGLGRFVFFNDCVRYASNRLRIHDLLERHPEIHAQEIRQPIIVLGLPRSGTTHLVNLIAADSRLRSMPLWEGQAPVAEDNPTRGAEDPRYARCAANWERMYASSPVAAAMHPMEPDHVHEELELMLPDFASYSQEWVARVPRWRDYHLSHDQRPHYAYLKTALKILQWYLPRDRWVLKCPQHLEQMGPLVETFPDATFVVTHRDPVSVVQSAATLNAYSARSMYTKTRPDWYLDYWTKRVQGLLESSVRDRPLLPAARTHDVYFEQFMREELGTVERIYETAGLEMTDTARGEIEAQRSHHQRGRFGRVVYDLRADFGVEPATVRRPFGFYFDRFPVAVEVE